MLRPALPVPLAVGLICFKLRPGKGLTNLKLARAVPGPFASKSTPLVVEVMPMAASDTKRRTRTEILTLSKLSGPVTVLPGPPGAAGQ